jgi:1,4-dihydroxy-6-naphthoate synthase
MKKVTLGFSPCPNDTFIFDALINKRIDTGNYIFEPVLADVEELNKKALEGIIEVTKLSFGVYAKVYSRYIILDSGAALGKRTGPVVVGRNAHSLNDLSNLSIIIPGKFTTANLLLSIFYPEVKIKKEMLFSEIEKAVLRGDADAGLLIHEGRFTYEEKGLKKIVDLGELWDEIFSLPLPLGCIAASRNFDSQTRTDISNLIRKSIEFAWDHPEMSKDYIKSNAQELNDVVIQQHINLYVNNYSVDLGDIGKDAILFLLQKGAESGLMPVIEGDIFNSMKKITI